MIKTRHLCSGMILALVMVVGSSVSAAPTADLSYRYASLEDIELPPGFLFFIPEGIDGSRRIYGELYQELGTDLVPYVAVCEEGAFRILGGPGVVNTVNEGGVAGGSLLDVESFREKAALFRDGKIEVIPALAGEYTSFVVSLSDNGIALVVSVDQNFAQRLVLYDGRRPIQLPINGSRLDINNQGVISGTAVIQGVGSRGFRYDSRTGKMTILQPTPTESLSWGMRINNAGEVVGYSFVSRRRERIGIWDQEAKFNVYFTEGTAEYPTVSNRLWMNDDNLIVITLANDEQSYLVPSPGVRLNVNSLVVNPPASPSAFSYVSAMNQRGDLVGYGSLGSFVLLRESSSR